MRNSILAIVSIVKKSHPVFNSHGSRVKLDAIEENSRSAIDTLSSSVLPEGTSIAVGVVAIFIAVAVGDVGLLELKLCCDLLSPPSLESILRYVSLTKDSLQVIEGEVLVLIAVAALAFSTEGHEVGHELGDLVRVHMVGQREGGGADGNLLRDSRTKPWLLEDLLKNGVESLAVSAKVVLEELDLDMSLVRSLNPSWISSKDWLGVS